VGPGPAASSMTTTTTLSSSIPSSKSTSVYTNAETASSLRERRFSSRHRLLALR
jgi:hypothetical protein